KLFTICSVATDISSLGDESIPYFKLHGTTDLSNLEEGRLILTQRDYDHYEKHRRRLFRRLSEDLGAKSFLFVGYSLSDPNILRIINDCRDELGIESIPKSYAIQRAVSPV